MNKWFRSYILPGLVFQSAIIGGAYGSGQELAQFFMPFGPGGGLLGIAFSTLVFSLVLAASYEFSRMFKLYDYRSFCKGLLGRFWIIYEILFVLIMILIISVVGAAGGTLFETTFGLPSLVGTIGLVSLIALLVFFGNKGMERVLAFWSFVLYGAYGLFLYWNLDQFGAEIGAGVSEFQVNEGWALSGLEYTGYNLATVPILLFVIRHLTTRKEAIGAGLIAGLIAMVPAALFYLAMIGQYDTLMDPNMTDLPVTVLLNSLEGAEMFSIIFPIVLFGTFIETGAALVHGLNERVASVYEERGKTLPNLARPVIAFGVLFVSIVLANMVGIVGLIGQGYGIITYGFLLVFVLPVLTWGVWKVYKVGEG